MNESTRVISLFSGATIALLLFGIGLIPSEGQPSAWDFFVFLVIPMLIAGIGIYFSRKLSEKIFMIVMLLIIVCLAVGLLFI